MKRQISFGFVAYVVGFLALSTAFGCGEEATDGTRESSVSGQAPAGPTGAPPPGGQVGQTNTGQPAATPPPGGTAGAGAQMSGQTPPPPPPMAGQGGETPPPSGGGADQACLDAGASGAGEACDACMCNACPDVVIAALEDPLARDIQQCAMTNKCVGDCCACGAVCDTSGTNYGMGPCIAELEVSAGLTPGLGALTNGMSLLTACMPNSGTPCAKVISLGDCVVASCLSECGISACM